MYYNYDVIKLFLLSFVLIIMNEDFQIQPNSAGSEIMQLNGKMQHLIPSNTLAGATLEIFKLSSLPTCFLLAQNTTQSNAGW